MPTFRRPKDHEHPYAPIPNTVLEDDRLSFKAKGLLCYLLSKSDDWEVYQSQLENLGPDGEHAVRSGLDELREAGYIDRNKKRGDLGEFAGYEYIIYEEPVATGSGKPETGKSSTGKSSIGKSGPTKDGQYQNGKNQSGSSSAGAREAPRMPDDLLPLYDTYEPEVNRLLQEHDADEADRLVMQQWGQVHVSNTILRLAKKTPFPYFVAGVVITKNEADSPNARYLDTLLTAITNLDEHTADDPTEEEQQSNLQRLWNAARTA